MVRRGSAPEPGDTRDRQRAPRSSRGEARPLERQQRVRIRSSEAGPRVDRWAGALHRIEPTINVGDAATNSRNYYSRWYSPGNMTAWWWGDTDPAMVADVIAQHFAAAARCRARPPRRGQALHEAAGHRGHRPELSPPRSRSRGSRRPAVRDHGGGEARENGRADRHLDVRPPAERRSGHGRAAYLSRTRRLASGGDHAA